MKAIVVTCLVTLAGLLHAADVAIPPNLHADGLPPIPETIADESAPFDEFRTATLLNWHPSQREMIISTRFGNTVQVHRVLMPGGARTQLTFFPDRVGDALYSPVAGATFVFTKDAGGAEFHQIYRYDVKTGKSTLLTNGKSRNGGVKWSPRGRWIAFSSTRRNGRDSDIWLMDPYKQESARMLLQNTESGWQPQARSADEKTLLATRHVSAEQSEIFRIDIATGARTALTSAIVQTVYESPQFSPEGRSTTLFRRLRSEKVALWGSLR